MYFLSACLHDGKYTLHNVHILSTSQGPTRCAFAHRCRNGKRCRILTPHTNSHMRRTPDFKEGIQRIVFIMLWSIFGDSGVSS